MTNLVSAFIAWPAALALAMSVQATQQSPRPRAEVTPIVESVGMTNEAQVVLQVRLPSDVHVQAHEPRDPSLIPTVLTLEAPPGVAVEETTYPPPTELAQVGRAEPLAVLGPQFRIEVRLRIAEGTTGDLVVPAVLRYQACNDAVCFPPARAAAEWRLHRAP
jgi:DsbC/DsbD-like thiol-disulfide interchange protein